MKPEDQEALLASFETYSDGSLSNYDHVAFGFKAAIAHRDAQASAINEQILNALKMVLDDPESLDGRPRTAKCVMEAIAAAEAHKGAA